MRKNRAGMHERQREQARETERPSQQCKQHEQQAMERHQQPATARGDAIRTRATCPIPRTHPPLRPTPQICATAMLLPPSPLPPHLFVLLRLQARDKRRAQAIPSRLRLLMCQTVVSYCLSSMADHKYPSIIFNNAMRARMYVRTYVCTYVYTHACTNARTHVRTHTRAHAHTHICTHAITHTYTHAHTHLANTESLCCVAEGAISRCRVRRSS